MKRSPLSIVIVLARSAAGVGGLTALIACGGATSANQAAADPSKAEHPLLGNAAPDFSQGAVANGSGDVSLHGLAGKVAIVDFWATWCGPCKKSFPKLQELNAKYRASGLAIVGISEDDDKAGIPDFAKDLGAKFPIAWDADKSIAGRWRPKSMPTTFILDRKGVVRFAHFGFHDGEELEIEREVKSLM